MSDATAGDDDQDLAESFDPDVVGEGYQAYPPERPLGVDQYGTTPAEERTDEPLEERVRREEPDASMETGRDAGRERRAEAGEASADDELQVGGPPLEGEVSFGRVPDDPDLLLVDDELGDETTHDEGFGPDPDLGEEEQPAETAALHVEEPGRPVGD
jgi:hypothetical protein